MCVLSHVWLWPHGLYSPAGSSVHGILQAGILEGVAISFSRESSHLRDWTRISCTSCIGGQILYHCTTWEALRYVKLQKAYLPGTFSQEAVGGEASIKGGNNPPRVWLTGHRTDGPNSIRLIHYLRGLILWLVARKLDKQNLVYLTVNSKKENIIIVLSMGSAVNNICIIIML